MEQAGIKSARLLEIYSRLNEGAVLKKLIWRRIFMSRREAFSVTSRTCAAFLLNGTWNRT